MSLETVPYEVISMIVQQIGLEDVFHLSLSSQRFLYLIREDWICKAVLESTSCATPEAKEARITQQYAFALRRLYRRRQAIRSAAPFTAATVAVAESWLYANGTLCYMQDKTSIRVLDLHKSSGEEFVIEVRTLLDEAVTESRGCRKYKFQILHYAEGILSCLYTQYGPHVESWLIVLHVGVEECKLLTTLALDTTYKIFVRNDGKYLYFGTHSEYGEDGFRRWVLMGYNIVMGTWFDQKVHLLDMVGSDIGQSIAFEIIDGKFYGLSSQASFEVDEVDWKSFYHCFRFPVAGPKPKETETSVKDRMWRRQHAEGPIDDRWSFIRLIKDDQDSKRLQVLESRKEWLGGQSSGRRNYYTTELIFPPPKEQDIEGEGSNTNDFGGGILINPRTDNSHDIRANFKCKPPLKPEFRTRCPLTTHPGDDASTALMFTLSKCFIRSYHPSSQTFLDLVDDPSQNNPETPRLQLRAGSRQLRPEEEILREPAALDSRLPHTERIKRIYRNEGENKITFWPPDDPLKARADPEALSELQSILNPPSYSKNIHGVWDDRSMVYSLAHTDGMQAIVFISFDPAIRLQGLKVWGDKSTGREGAAKTTCANGEPWYEEGSGKGKEVAVEAAESPKFDGFSSPQSDGYCPGWTPEAPFDWGPGGTGQDPRSEDEASSPGSTTAVSASASPKGTDSASPPARGGVGSPSADSSAAKYPMVYAEPRGATPSGPERIAGCNWAKKEPAMYKKILSGFNNMPDFSSPRRTA
ncbi:hypothetical protein VPNG_05421 [Cytospora leucostoma]|uniref:F-box domain-containing protein n=1 Tax=Cytospora leucostoma TaxID=1230097 RepID=A0A423XBD7_9PEZI|nr:hypothetical protein VPNG_05421 [Cytospora leucostoma]